MRRSYKKSVRKDLYARKHEPRHKKKTSKKHVHVKGKRKLYHKVGQHRVHGIWYKGRFYSPKHHYKANTQFHHSIRHQGKVYHTAHKDKHITLKQSWDFVKDKYKALKHWNAERVEKKQYYKENLTKSQREKVQQDLNKKNPEYQESERLRLQHKYDDQEDKGQW